MNALDQQAKERTVREDISKQRDDAFGKQDIFAHVHTYILECVSV